MANKPNAMSETAMDEVTKNTGEALKEQGKVKVKLYLDPETNRKLKDDEEKGRAVDWPTTVVGVNGYNYQIQHGKQVEVPETVAQILEDAGLI